MDCQDKLNEKNMRIRNHVMLVRARKLYSTIGGVTVGSRLAEGEEGVSEARTWRGSGVKPYYLDWCVRLAVRNE